MKKLKIDFSNYSHLKVKNQRVMVKLIPLDYTKTASGIALTSKDSAKNTSTIQGVVVAVGEPYILPNSQTAELDYKIGDVVYFSEASGVDFKVFRGDGNFEDVKCVSCESIYFVDGAGSLMYEGCMTANVNT